MFDDSDAVAVFVIVVLAVPVFTVARKSNVPEDPAGKLPTVQIPVEVAYDPGEVVAETKVRPAGKRSLTSTSVEVAGPKAETLTV